MRVTFRHDGRIVHAAVESPAPPPQEALDCVSEQLEAALVPRFDGVDATLSKSFFVAPGDPNAQPEDVIVRREHRKAAAAGPVTELEPRSAR